MRNVPLFGSQYPFSLFCALAHRLTISKANPIKQNFFTYMRSGLSKINPKVDEAVKIF
jgi:hypothetical protein